jgi:hypothetical protein
MSVAADYAEQEYLVVTESEPEALRGSCTKRESLEGTPPCRGHVARCVIRDG